MEFLPDTIEDTTLEADSPVETIPEITFNSDPDQFISQDPVFDLLHGMDVYAAVPYAASSSVQFDDSHNIYTISFNGSTLHVLFPEDASLAVVDGVLINTGSASVTGVVLSSSNSAAINSYHESFLTLYSFTSTSGNTSLYRYAATAYLTNYVPYNATQLNTSVTYGNPEVINSPKSFRGFMSGGVSTIIVVLLTLLVLIQFFGGIFRR